MSQPRSVAAKVEEGNLQKVRDAVDNIVAGHTESEIALQYAERWRQATGVSLGRVLSVLAGRSISTEWVGTVPLAATDGENLLLSIDWFASSIVPKVLARRSTDTAEAWGWLRAASYHELAHILWTPRATHQPTKQIIQNTSLWRTWNMLEDQRIESLFVTRWAPSAPGFAAIVLEFVINNDNSMAWLLLHGRKYLKPEIRAIARRRFERDYGVDVADRAAALIDEYRAMVFPTDGERAIEVVAEFNSLIRSLEPSEGSKSLTSALRQLEAPESGGHNFHTKGRSESVADVRDLRDQMLDSESDGTEPACQSEAADESGEGCLTESFDEGSGGHSDELVSDNLEAADIADSGVSNDIDRMFNKMANEELDSFIDELIDDGLDMLKDVAREMRECEAAAIPKVADTWGRKMLPVSPWMVSGARIIQNGIANILSEGREQWNRGMSSGRLNITDAMTARGQHFDIFEQWQDTDELDLSFELVLLIDRSSSMHGLLSDSVNRASWIIRRAFDELEIPTTVIGYNHQARMEATRQDLAMPGQFDVFGAHGGTNPHEALVWADRILQASSANNKVLVSLTDGAWNYGSRVKERMRSIRHIGTHTLFVTVGASAGSWVDRTDGVNGHREWIDLQYDVHQLPKQVANRIAKMARELATS